MRIFKLNKQIFEKKVIDFVKNNLNLILDNKDYSFVCIFEKNIHIDRNIEYYDLYQSIKDFNFSTNIIIIVKNKIKSSFDFILISRSIAAINLRSIGEIKAEALISNPLKSLIFGTSGCSTDLNILLIDDNINKRLLYEDDHKIIDIYQMHNDLFDKIF